jgi:hypothetical protein
MGTIGYTTLAVQYTQIWQAHPQYRRPDVGRGVRR